jgi:intein/homing endonuclease
VTLRPPSKLRKITLGGSEIITTLGHPFWVDGIGWKMAKELQPGQNLHALQGAALIARVDEVPQSEQAYNLVVADYNTYFVGSANVLVHDNLYRQPTLAKVPGLVEAGK